MSLNSPDASASHKDGSLASRLSGKWSDIFGASCTSSVEWECYAWFTTELVRCPRNRFCLYLFSRSMVRESDVPMRNISCNTWFSCSNFCLLSVPCCRPHYDRVFQRLSALIWFWSVCLLRIEKRFETWGVEPGFISFNLNPIMRPCKSLLLLQLFSFRDSQEEVQELEGWERGPQHHTHSTCSDK